MTTRSRVVGVIGLIHSISLASGFVAPVTSSHLKAASSTAAMAGPSSPRPNLPIPPPLLSLEPGTWAHDTMSRRLNEEIFQRTYEENEEVLLSPPFERALARFRQLRAELTEAATTKLRHVQFDKDTDGRPAQAVEQEEREWRDIMGPYVDDGDTWLSAPWLVTEFYAYRRLMEVSPATHSRFRSGTQSGDFMNVSLN